MNTAIKPLVYLATSPDGEVYLVDEAYIASRSAGLSPEAADRFRHGASFTVEGDGGDWRYEAVSGPFENLLHDTYEHHDHRAHRKVTRDKLSTAVSMQRTRWNYNAELWVLTDGTIVLVAAENELSRYVPVREEQ